LAVRGEDGFASALVPRRLAAQGPRHRIRVEIVPANPEAQVYFVGVTPEPDCPVRALRNDPRHTTPPRGRTGIRATGAGCPIGAPRLLAVVRAPIGAARGYWLGRRACIQTRAIRDEIRARKEKPARDAPRHRSGPPPRRR